MTFGETMAAYFPSAERVEIHAGRGKAETLPIGEAIEKYGKWHLVTAAGSIGKHPRAWVEKEGEGRNRRQL